MTAVRLTHLLSISGHTIAVTFDGSTFKVYKDPTNGDHDPIITGGAPAASFTDSETILELMGYAQDSGSTTTADAQMTDIRIAPRALTDDEILAWHKDLPSF